MKLKTYAKSLVSCSKARKISNWLTSRCFVYSDPRIKFFFIKLPNHLPNSQFPCTFTSQICPDLFVSFYSYNVYIMNELISAG